MKKFADNGVYLRQFSDYRIIKCPKCERPIDFRGQKITCTHCGYNRVFECEGFWGIPKAVEITLFLNISCCGNVLWAVNEEHLDFLEQYVASELRERTPNINKSLASRLPQWIKSRKNRDEVLKAISKLRKSLEAHQYQSRKKE
jgi:hypothetical protein